MSEKKIKLPSVPRGMKRQWVKCRKCGRTAYYDYIPYGIGNPIKVLPCSHGTGQRFSDGVRYLDYTPARYR